MENLSSFKKVLPLLLTDEFFYLCQHFLFSYFRLEQSIGARYALLRNWWTKYYELAKKMMKSEQNLDHLFDPKNNWIKKQLVDLKLLREDIENRQTTKTDDKPDYKTNEITAEENTAIDALLCLCIPKVFLDTEAVPGPSTSSHQENKGSGGGVEEAASHENTATDARTADSSTMPFKKRPVPNILRSGNKRAKTDLEETATQESSED